jgi:hypothetical protein
MFIRVIQFLALIILTGRQGFAASLIPDAADFSQATDCAQPDHFLALEQRVTYDHRPDVIFCLDSDGRLSAFAVALILSKMWHLCPCLPRELGAILCKGSGLILSLLVAAGVPPQDIARYLFTLDTKQSAAGFGEWRRTGLAFMKGVFESVTGKSNDCNRCGYTSSANHDEIALRAIDLVCMNRMIDLACLNGPLARRESKIAVIQVDRTMDSCVPNLTESVSERLHAYNERKETENKEKVRQEFLETIFNIATGSTLNELQKDRRQQGTISDAVEVLRNKKLLGRDVIMIRIQSKLDNTVSRIPIVSFSEQCRETADGKSILIVGARVAIPQLYASEVEILNAIKHITRAVKRLFADDSPATRRFRILSGAVMPGE